jgi:hypothetical protein
MLQFTYFTSNIDFEKEFERCCIEYLKLTMYVAWVGDRGNLILFNY